MSLADFRNYVFIPGSASAANGILYELSDPANLGKNGFVLLPYQNPQVKKTVPKFFKIKNKFAVESLSPETKKIPVDTIFLTARTSRESYIKKVCLLKDQIQKGNIYEINYCIEFVADHVEIDPVSVFLKLHGLSKAPYAMLFKSGDEYIISASPELFLKKEGNRILTKPIKGTIRRGENSDEDEQLKNQLHSSIKERTENVMAVDVARNDLSMFAAKGMVHVNKLYNIETFETVHQMVSTVSCEIKENTDAEKIIDSTFPMASMTGAPKLRAMQLIDEFEDFERNYYSGAIGLIDDQGDFTLSVVIRSIFYNQKTKHLSIAVGGAITYLSEPEKEHEECLLKANALLKALNAEIS
jgi:para-aminobenzoate synthetase component 1